MGLQASDILFDDQIVSKSIPYTLVVTLKKKQNILHPKKFKFSNLRRMMEHSLNFIHSLECCVLEILVALMSKDKIDH